MLDASINSNQEILEEVDTIIVSDLFGWIWNRWRFVIAPCIGELIFHSAMTPKFSNFEGVRLQTSTFFIKDIP